MRPGVATRQDDDDEAIYVNVSIIFYLYLRRKKKGEMMHSYVRISQLRSLWKRVYTNDVCCLAFNRNNQPMFNSSYTLSAVLIF